MAHAPKARRWLLLIVDCLGWHVLHPVSRTPSFCSRSFATGSAERSLCGLCLRTVQHHLAARDLSPGTSSRNG
jgi:hypothetical protein